MDLSKCPSGWFPIPKNWVCAEQEDGMVTFVKIMNKEGRKTVVPITNVEYMMNKDNGQIYWRKEVVQKNDDKSNYGKIKEMANAMATMSTLIEGDDRKKKDVRVEDTRFPAISLKVNATEPNKNYGNLQEWIEIWEGLAANSKDFKPLLRPAFQFNFNWNEGSDTEKLTKFLSGPKASVDKFPDKFYTSHTELTALMTKDHDARKMAGIAFNALSLLDIMSEQFKIASSQSSEDKEFDTKLALDMVAKMSEGIGVIITPLAKELMRNSIMSRLGMRTKTVPYNLDAAKRELLRTSPFDTLPFGKEESVIKIVKSVPKAAQIKLPWKIEKTLYNEQDRTPRFQQKNFFQNKRKFNNDDNNDERNFKKFYKEKMNTKEEDKNENNYKGNNYQNRRGNNRKNQSFRNNNNSGNYSRNNNEKNNTRYKYSQ